MEVSLIREIADEDGLKNSARVIRNSFRTVAAEFGLTRVNCPTHPTFTTISQLRELRAKGVRFFGFFLGEKQVGCVGIEKSGDNPYWMEKLAVIPKHRHQGYGERLVEFALDYVREKKGPTLSLGMINEHTVLKDWYKKLGFRETGIKRFSHLPFDVCFMEIDTRPGQTDSQGTS
jgi:ribosomal protein S18 acetylase RimI-like enzyme